MHHNIKAGRNTKLVLMNANLFICKKRQLTRSRVVLRLLISSLVSLTFYAICDYCDYLYIDVRTREMKAITVVFMNDCFYFSKIWIVSDFIGLLLILIINGKYLRESYKSL